MVLSAEYLAFLDSLDGVLEGASTGDSVGLLQDFNAHVGNNSETWKRMIGRNRLPDLNLNGYPYVPVVPRHPRLIWEQVDQFCRSPPKLSCSASVALLVYFYTCEIS